MRTEFTLVLLFTLVIACSAEQQPRADADHLRQIAVDAITNRMPEVKADDLDLREVKDIQNGKNTVGLTFYLKSTIQKEESDTETTTSGAQIIVLIGSDGVVLEPGVSKNDFTKKETKTGRTISGESKSKTIR